MQAVCDTYREAPALHKSGTHVVCCDEKTGIQALERIAPTKPTRPGLTERIEFEYVRHGTLCLIANFEVATGRVDSFTIGPTRTELNFAGHIEHTVETDPSAAWVFVVDRLTTHMSATLVGLVATWCGITEDLGIKGREGILKCVATRLAFLADPSHRVRFVFPPKHSSWLNQVEIWFSVLVRRLLKRSSFTSLDDLRDRITAFIAYFNSLLARPYRWTYTGRALKAA